MLDKPSLYWCCYIRTGSQAGDISQCCEQGCRQAAAAAAALVGDPAGQDQELRLAADHLCNFLGEQLLVVQHLGQLQQ
jgi:hypothetical protein